MEEHMVDFVIRYVATVPCKDGIGRTLMCAAQGRYTHATPEEAQAWIDGYLTNNSQSTLDEFGRDVQVRSCRCYPGHFDPMGVYFDMPDSESFLQKPPTSKTQGIPTKYKVTLRSKTTFKTEQDVIEVWPGQTPESVADRIAEGYGATVESVVLAETDI
jgi:hypothetical protein